MLLIGNVKIDRWLVWPVLASLLVVVTLTFVCAIPGQLSFVMIPISLHGYLIAIMFACFKAGTAMEKITDITVAYELLR
jgi:hypothetical protein